jgi:hypothetical protein
VVLPQLQLPVKKVKSSRYRPGVAQRVGRGIALLFHDRGIRKGWVVNSTPRPHFTPGKDPVPILQEAGWTPGPVWTCGKSRPHRDSIPDRPARSQSLYRLSYPAHVETCRSVIICEIILHLLVIVQNKKNRMYIRSMPHVYGVSNKVLRKVRVSRFSQRFC